MEQIHMNRIPESHAQIKYTGDYGMYLTRGNYLEAMHTAQKGSSLMEALGTEDFWSLSIKLWLGLVVKVDTWSSLLPGL